MSNIRLIIAGLVLMLWAYWRAGKTEPTLFGP